MTSFGFMNSEKELPMRRSFIVGVFGCLTIALAPSSLAQELPAQGFTALVCQLGVSGSGTFEIGNGHFTVTIVDNGADSSGTGTASAAITHGQTGSSHELTYEDNGSGVLDCGDLVVSVI
jgi:hypothetical protein